MLQSLRYLLIYFVISCWKEDYRENLFMLMYLICVFATYLMDCQADLNKTLDVHLQLTFGANFNQDGFHSKAALENS